MPDLHTASFAAKAVANDKVARSSNKTCSALLSSQHFVDPESER